MAQVGLEFSEHSEHIKERFAGRGPGVDGLLCRLQLGPLCLQLVHDVLQVFERPGEPVDARDHQGVALAQEIEQHLQFGAPVATSAGGLLRTDDIAAGGFQDHALECEVLVDRADALTRA